MTYKPRRYQRYLVEGSVTLKIKSCSIAADLKDISFTGMHVCADKEIKPGSKVKFEIVSNLSSVTIAGEGEVKYAKKKATHDAKLFKMGIEFINVNESAIEHLINRIQKAIATEKRKKKAKAKPFINWDW
ncbi:MAG: PilZ domain-containing protein [Candidatus Gorgyraea atricola]|nr:PilZ domain-containing protein [Candidatus Gorgyraea atricola]